MWTAEAIGSWVETGLVSNALATYLAPVRAAERLWIIKQVHFSVFF